MRCNKIKIPFQSSEHATVYASWAVYLQQFDYHYFLAGGKEEATCEARDGVLAANVAGSYISWPGRSCSSPAVASGMTVVKTFV